MKQIIAELGAEQGATIEAIKKWRQRGEVPPKYRLPLLNIAKRRKLPLTERDFEFKGTAKSRAD
jgi:hypothetical protein